MYYQLLFFFLPLNIWSGLEYGGDILFPRDGLVSEWLPSEFSSGFILLSLKKRKKCSLLKAIPISQLLSAAQCIPWSLRQLGQCLIYNKSTQKNGPLAKTLGCKENRNLLDSEFNVVAQVLVFEFKVTLFSSGEATCPF